MKANREISFGRRILPAMQAGVTKAIAEHKRAGRSIAVWKDGKVTIIPPEKIRVPRIRRPRHRPETE
jgi:hypothetical protein